MPAFDPEEVRRQFPALLRQVNGRPAVFFDGPAGSQVPRRVATAVADYLVSRNANTHGAFATSVESDAMLAEAHRAAADFLGCADADLVTFGANMTTLTFALSRALATTWKPGDEVIVTRLDHDANVTPWVRAAKDAGATIHSLGLNPEDCTLRRDDFAKLLSPRTKLVAVGAASNATGTVNPVKELTAQAHAVGALVFVDAVHYAPQLLPDVTDWDCDFLACSAYKFFGPHVGLLYGKRKWMEELPAYKVRPADDELPGRWMTGTQNHEGIAGTLAAIDYLAGLGQGPDRRSALRAAYAAIGEYERKLGTRLLDGLAKLPGVRAWGIADSARFAERVPTVAVTHDRHSPQHLATELARRGMFTWAGNFYAVELIDALGVADKGGVLRIGLLHYNTAAEVDRLVSALREIVG